MHEEMTRRELMELEDALYREMLEIETYGNYIQQTDDPEMKRVLEDIQRSHQKHYERLIDQMNPGNRGT